MLMAGEEGRATLHTMTAQWVTEQVLGVPLDEGGRREAVSFGLGRLFGEENRTSRMPCGRRQHDINDMIYDCIDIVL